MISRKLLTLRPYQEKFVGDVRASFAAGNRRVLGVSPTGSGKTVMFSAVARSTVQRSKRVLVLAHRIELLEQCGDKLYSNYVDYGFLNPRYTPDLSFKVQVGSVQTVYSRLRYLNFKPDLIIIDEAHRAHGSMYAAILSYYPDAYVLGVTATPIRSDGQSMGKVFHDMIIGPSGDELVAMGSLIKPTMCVPEEDIDLSDVLVGANGEYIQWSLEQKMNRDGLVGDAVAEYKEICPGVPAVAFCSGLKHSMRTAAEFTAAGFPFFHVDGDTEPGRRKKLIKMLKRNEICGLTSVDLFIEGLDVEELRAGILMRPTNNVGPYLQACGRIMRPSEDTGKTEAFILDHANCYRKHGHPTAPRKWELHLPEKQKRKRGPRGSTISTYVATTNCSKCGFEHKPKDVCPNCGYISDAELPKSKPGKLVQLTPQMEMKIKMERAKEVTDAETLQELLAIEHKRGYKPGWARQVFNSRNKRLGFV